MDFIARVDNSGSNKRDPIMKEDPHTKFLRFNQSTYILLFCITLDLPSCYYGFPSSTYPPYHHYHHHHHHHCDRRHHLHSHRHYHHHHYYYYRHDAVAGDDDDDDDDNGVSV